MNWPPKRCIGAPSHKRRFLALPKRGVWDPYCTNDVLKKITGGLERSPPFLVDAKKPAHYWSRRKIVKTRSDTFFSPV